MKKFILILVLLLSFSPLFSKDLIQNQFNLEANYYGLPVNVKAGYLYRYNDVSIFPYVALEYNCKDYLYWETSLGFTFGFKNFSWDNKFAYEIFPSLFEKDFDIFYGQTAPSISFNYAKFSLPIIYGKHNYKDFSGVKHKRDFLSMQLASKFFLLEEGWIKGNLNTSATLTNVFKSDFTFYDIFISMPFTLCSNYVDVAFNYTFRYLSELKNGHTQELLDVSIPYSDITSRPFFVGDAKKYNHIHSFEVETRWYFLRYKHSFSSWFLSMFANVGWGINYKKECDILYEYGIGGGYTLVDNVPFTLQVGLNQDNKFCLYVGVVSRLTQTP